MKRMLKWGVIAAAALLCAVSGLYLYRVFMNYSNLRQDVNRQITEINTLRLEQSRYAAGSAEMKSVSETVSFLSTQISGCCLTERSLRSEKSCLELDGWEEWNIEAVCTGSVDNLDALIESLEAAGTYHNMNFSVGINGEGLYELSMGLSFYARCV